MTAGCDADLFYRRLTVREFCAADPQRLTDSQTVRVKIRGVGRNPEGYARVRIDGQSLLVELREPAWAPSFSTTATWSSEEASSPTAGGKTLRKSVNPIVPVTFYALRSPGLKNFW